MTETSPARSSICCSHTARGSISMFRRGEKPAPTGVGDLTGTLLEDPVARAQASPASHQAAASAKKTASYWRRMALQLYASGLELTPDEMAGAAVYFASAASSFVTGQTLILDGGRVLRGILWKATGSFYRATNIAGLVGIGFAWLLILRGFAVFLFGGSLFGWIRDWMSIENLPLVVYDEPAWFEEMVTTLADLQVAMLEKAFATGARFQDLAHEGEDGGRVLEAVVLAGLEMNDMTTADGALF